MSITSPKKNTFLYLSLWQIYRRVHTYVVLTTGLFCVIACIHSAENRTRNEASSLEKLGDFKSCQKIYISLARDYPKSKHRHKILHEATRFSYFVGDCSSAQYYGNKFMREFPGHCLENNVATFMLQSLFAAHEYKKVIEICKKIREKFDADDSSREMADHLYGGALYFMEKHEAAQQPLDAFANKYPSSDNLESALYWQASNYVILEKYVTAGKFIDAYIKKFPQSKYLDLALFDRATCYFNVGEYEKAIVAVDRIKGEHKNSVVLDRALNLAGDAYDVLAGFSADNKDRNKELTVKALEYFSTAIVEGKKRNSRESVPEALARSADLSIRLEHWDDAVKYYDEFFPDYKGTLPWEPQISVFTMVALEKAGRAEDGLKQLEGMINSMGKQKTSEQDTELLRQAIGSYSEASVRTRGAEKTAEIFGDFPGVNPKDQTLLAWLNIQKIIILQGMRNSVNRDSPDYEEIQGRIARTFGELMSYGITNLPDFVLRQIGRYLRATDNPSLAKPYFEELRIRSQRVR